MTRVAFQGELGAYSEDGIIQLWGESAEPVPCREFLNVAQAVDRGEVDLGLLPIENTLAGSVVGSYDALAACPSLHVVAETVVAIHHCVLGRPGATLQGLRAVASHPVALAQCGQWLRGRPALMVRAAYDTGGAARNVAANTDLSVAAIAGRPAAARYGLELLAADIEDRPDNQTRFLAIARDAPTLPADTPARTTLSLITRNVPGALLNVLHPLATHGLNMSKLESRPTGEPWRYRFFVEFEHPAGSSDAAAAIDAMRAASEVLRVLGSFARA